MDQERTVTANFALDKTAPDTTLTKKPKKHTTKRTAKFRFTASEENAKFTCQLDARKPKSCSSPYRKHVSLGKHSFRVFASDAAGNDDATPAKARWKVLER
jgi:chaperone required for assembly of F1-ATPase